MSGFAQDVRYALRQLRSAPVFTVVAVVSLGLGIGAATTVFCWMRNVLWRPIPGAADQSALVMLVSSQGGGGVSLPDLRDFDAYRPAFSGAAASQLTPASVTVERQPEWLHGQVVTSNFFEVLGVKPIAGRTFRPEEDRHPGGDFLVVISETYWRRRLGADPGVIGRQLDINRHAFEIVGIVPAEFRGTMTGLRFDFWAPLSMQREVGNRFGDSLSSRSARGYHNVARLQPGVGLAEARAAVAVLDAQLAAAFPRSNREVRHRVVTLAESPSGAQAVIGDALRLLLVVSLGVLLIVAANVANLLLGRASARQKEIAIRLAAGADRLRLVRQLVTESLCLALLGGGLGVALASFMVGLLRLLLPASGIARNIALDYRLDGASLAAGLALSLATAIVFGLVPALQASRPHLYATLKEGGRGSGGSAHHGVRSLLVVGEVALALVLLVGAGLCLRGLATARTIDIGFDRQNVLIADLQVGMNGYTETTAIDLYRRIQARLEELPGVRRASLASWFPLGLGGCKGSDAQVEGYQRPPGEDTTYEYARVAEGYFDLMGIPLLAGRDFTAADDARAEPVAIVNEHFASRFWPGQDALGRRFRAQGKVRTIVGVARAGKYNRLDERPWPFFYLPQAQGVPDLDLSVAVRTEGDPLAYAQALQRAIHEIDPAVNVLGTKTLEGHTEAIYFAQRVASFLLAVLGAIGVVLACMGVYAVTAYAVSRRTQEFGLRAALGATTSDLVRLVLRQGVALALAGCAAGLLGALVLARALSAFLYGVSPFDPLTFVGVPLLLVACSLAASLAPALKAARVDPMNALRCE